MLDWANIVILVFEPLTFKVFKFGLVTWSLNENIAASLNHSYSCLELWSFRKICIHHNLNIKFTPQSRNKRPIAHRHVHTHTSTQLSSTVFELNDRKTEQTHSEIHAHYKHLQQRKKKNKNSKTWPHWHIPLSSVPLARPHQRSPPPETTSQRPEHPNVPVQRPGDLPYLIVGVIVLGTLVFIIVAFIPFCLWRALAKQSEFSKCDDC